MENSIINISAASGKELNRLYIEYPKLKELLNEGFVVVKDKDEGYYVTDNDEIKLRIDSFITLSEVDKENKKIFRMIGSKISNLNNIQLENVAFVLSFLSTNIIFKNRMDLLEGSDLWDLSCRDTIETLMAIDIENYEFNYLKIIMAALGKNIVELLLRKI